MVAGHPFHEIDTFIVSVNISFFFTTYYTISVPNWRGVIPMQTFGFIGKVAIVTGGGGGIGRSMLKTR
ncbi:hypothetical protein BpJC7_11530 [Weizmannia acidilactici]|uniref:Uncharacterized protein n=1 Tax=Weizmannia acidilactici TaxID=2607726 RepID=A0A5J4JH59_9BACI|nr:hypothetical protein BpJC4_16790 [Weizmannia acidilactici]GER69850.1 hypothetical protein BpJC7_11530 [Weizmannia acidilactici]GER73371.1 hypothetical protein BpPP18_14380 [Weizmannia acidilactici]